MTQDKDGVDSKKRDRPKHLSPEHSQKHISRETMHLYPLIDQQSTALIETKTEQQ